MQVRNSQLDKEGAELREENVSLHARVSGLDDARSKASAEEVGEQTLERALFPSILKREG
jgi:hypothetical protein